MLHCAFLLLMLAACEAEPSLQKLPEEEASQQGTAARPRPRKGARAAEDDDEHEWVEVTHEADFLEMFAAGEVPSARGRGFRYRLFAPLTAGPEDRRPLIVWLHGKGEAGDDNSSHLRHLSTLIFTKPWQRERYPFFLLAVQCRRNNPLWMSSSENADDMLEIVLAALQQVRAEHPIDPQRIVLAGISSGGSGCWELAMREPDLFAAVAPLGSGSADVSRLNTIAHLPIWSFHSTGDPGTPVQAVRDTVAALAQAGGNAHLTEVNLRLHDCWHAAFEHYELLPWLLAQKRGDPSAPAPGSISLPARGRLIWRCLSTGWTPSELAGQIGIPLLLCVAIWSARRQKRLRRSSQQLPGG